MVVLNPKTDTPRYGCISHAVKMADGFVAKIIKVLKFGPCFIYSSIFRKMLRKIVSRINGNTAY